MPDYEGDKDVDQFNIHLAQFVKMSKIDFKSFKKHATSKMKRSSINIFQTNQNTKGAEVASKINSIELLQKAFQKNSLTSVY